MTTKSSVDAQARAAIRHCVGRCATSFLFILNHFTAIDLYIYRTREFYSIDVKTLKLKLKGVTKVKNMTKI